MGGSATARRGSLIVSCARSVLGGGSTYTLIGEDGPRGPLAVRVRNASDELLGTTLEPRVWVVRVR